MIRGEVSPDGIPQVKLVINGVAYAATIDTGFNGDLELPETLSQSVNAVYVGQITSALAGGQSIDEDAYLVDFPFLGSVVQATATFVPGHEILIGTQFLREYRLEIHFRSRIVELELEASLASQ